MRRQFAFVTACLLVFALLGGCQASKSGGGPPRQAAGDAYGYVQKQSDGYYLKDSSGQYLYRLESDLALFGYKGQYVHIKGTVENADSKVPRFTVRQIDRAKSTAKERHRRRP
ncbi:MAG: hypothetical protein ABEJ65_07380 [bacterium]